MTNKKQPIEDAISYAHEAHPRTQGFWSQYAGLETRLSGRVYYSDIIDKNTKWETYGGEAADTIDLRLQTPENYHDSHNHYQLILSEVKNFLPGTNAIPIWGDGAAIENGSAAWGGFFSARSDYITKADIKTASPLVSGVPLDVNEGCAKEDYDCSLTGLEVDVLNAGKPGVFPNKPKHGVTIVGFGNPNSHAVSIICENFDCEPRLRKGQFEAGVYFQNSLHPDYGRLVVSDMTNAHIGLDFRATVFNWGAMHINGAGQGTGIVFNSGAGGELYSGKRWGDKGVSSGEWMTVRLAEVGLRVVSADGTAELLTIQNPDKTKSDESIEVSSRPVVKINGIDILHELDELRKRVSQMEMEVSTFKIDVAPLSKT